MRLGVDVVALECTASELAGNEPTRPVGVLALGKPAIVVGEEDAALAVVPDSAEDGAVIRGPRPEASTLALLDKPVLGHNAVFTEPIALKALAKR